MALPRSGLAAQTGSGRTDL